MHITSGRDRGLSATFRVADTDFSVPAIHAGDRVVLAFNRLAPAAYRYSFEEFNRSSPLLLLFVLFVVVVVGFGRWKGVRALTGLAISATAIMFFLLPALLNGRDTS